MMHTSCQLLADSLPDDTLLYCAHEYTESNARFALIVEPSNTELQVRRRREERLGGHHPVLCVFVARVAVVVVACYAAACVLHRARQPHNVSHIVLHRSLPYLQRRVEEVGRLRAAGLSTVPTTMGEEKRTNPFLRVGRQVVGGGEGGEEGDGVTEIRRTLGFGNNADDVDVFAELRARKDNF